MKLVFWQNIISIHQYAFLESLVVEYGIEVLLIYNERNSVRRINEGWVTEFDIHFNVIHVDDIDIVSSNSNEILNVISGFGIDEISKIGISYSIKLCQEYIIISESFDERGLKGFIRRIKYFFKVNKVNPKLCFSYGDIGVRQFKKLSFNNQIYFPLSYTIDSKLAINSSSYEKNDVYRIIFVGRLDKCKDVMLLLKSINYVCHNNLINLYLDIVGNGPDRKILENYIYKYDLVNYVSFHGVVENSKVYNYISSSDLLVLPSKYDGWGAVVNEALSVGTRVLVSDKCGSSCLFDENSFHGKHFKPNYRHLASLIYKFYTQGKLNDVDRYKIKQIYNKTIHPKVIARYFLEVINSDGNKKISTPWTQ